MPYRHIHRCASARPHLIVLDDHARLPWRFFGRMTAAIQAGL